MQFFALNTKYSHPIITNSPGRRGERGTFTVKSVTDDVGITDKTQFVMLEDVKNNFTFTKKAQITKRGKIVEVPPTREQIERHKQNSQKPPRTSYLQDFDYEVDDLLAGYNTLKDLEYSLKFVKSYNNPIVHFHQTIRTLEKDDFETINKGLIYMIRTVFGKIVNVLPRQNKLEFMLQSMDKFSTIDFKGKSLYDGYQFLLEYLDRRILQKGRLLMHSDNLLKSNFDHILPVEEIGFIDPERTEGNILSEQADLFRKLFDSTSGNKSIDKILSWNNAPRDHVESRFEKIFESQTWPIDLRA
jgi:hypothetical protein